MTGAQSGSKSGLCLAIVPKPGATMLDKVAGFQDSRSMAKKRAARAANPRATLASRGPKQNPAQSANPNSQKNEVADQHAGSRGSNLRGQVQFTGQFKVSAQRLPALDPSACCL